MNELLIVNKYLISFVDNMFAAHFFPIFLLQEEVRMAAYFDY